MVSRVTYRNKSSYRVRTEFAVHLAQLPIRGGCAGAIGVGNLIFKIKYNNLKIDRGNTLKSYIKNIDE